MARPRKQLEQTWRDKIGELSRRQEYRGTRTLEIDIEIDTEKPFALVVTGDWHIGGVGFDADKWQSDMDLILSSQNTAMLLMGDEIDNFTWLAGMHEQVFNPDEQLDLLNSFSREAMARGSILGRVGGNHTDEWMVKKAGIEFSQVMYGGRDIPSLKDGGFFNLTVGAEDYRILARHKTLNNSSINVQYGNKRMLMEQGPADIVVSGHDHQLGVSEEYNYSGGVLSEVWLGKSGSYKRYDSYALSEGFKPSKTGAIVFVLMPHEHKVYGFSGVEEGLKFRSLLKG